nr:Chain E, CYCLIN-DEPENDENT KINASE INHIBITOR 1B [Homo sapiens]
KPSACRNLFGP